MLGTRRRLARAGRLLADAAGRRLTRVMRVDVLHPSEVPALRRFAERDLPSSMFLLGNLLANGFEDRGAPRHGTYAAA